MDMDALPPTVLAAKKDSDPVGTYEDNSVAFQLWLDDAPPLFGSFGFHAITHLGVYGEEYTPCLPICLVSVPCEDYDLQLPRSVADVLYKCEDLRLLRRNRIELLLHIHSGLSRQPCAHFSCDRTDEFNIMVHAWCFSNDNVADGSGTISANVFIGVFEAEGVEPRHLDVFSLSAAGGAAFNKLRQMEVLLHDRRFSPNNASVGLIPVAGNPAAAGTTSLQPLPAHDAPRVVVFFSVAVDKELKRGIVTLHVLPVDNDASADAVRGWMRGVDTLGQLLLALQSNIPGAYSHLLKMLSPRMVQPETGANGAAVSS